MAVVVSLEENNDVCLIVNNRSDVCYISKHRLDDIKATVLDIKEIEEDEDLSSYYIKCKQPSKYIKEINTGSNQCTQRNSIRHFNLDFFLYKRIILSGKEYEFKVNTDVQKIEKRLQAMGCSPVRINDSVLIFKHNEQYKVYTSEPKFTVGSKVICDEVAQEKSLGFDRMSRVINKSADSTGGNENIDTSCMNNWEDGFLSYTTHGNSIDFSIIDFSNAVTLRKCFYYFDGANVYMSKCDFGKALFFTEMFKKALMRKLDLSNNKTTKNLVDMEGMFSNAHINEIRLNGLNTKNVVSMSEMFFLSDGSIIDLSNIDTSNCRDMSSMFRNCVVDKVLGIEDLNTDKVVNMTSMFSEAIFKSKDLDLSKYNTSKVKYKHSLFYDCLLGTVDISGWNFDSLVSATHMFSRASINTLIVSEPQYNFIKELVGNNKDVNVVRRR